MDFYPELQPKFPSPLRLCYTTSTPFLVPSIPTALFKMMTAFSCIIFLKIWTMVSNFKIIPYFNILQNFVQKYRKPKWSSILSWLNWVKRPQLIPSSLRFLAKEPTGRCQKDLYELLATTTAIRLQKQPC